LGGIAKKHLRRVRDLNNPCLDCGGVVFWAALGTCKKCGEVPTHKEFWTTRGGDGKGSRENAYYTEGPEMLMWLSSRNSAKSRGIKFTISVDDITIPTHCPLLGTKLVKTLGKGLDINTTASLDRKDNTKGYVKGNVWVVSYRANTIKNNATLGELRQIVSGLEKEIGGVI
jgi:hypothetical protein